MFQKARSSLVSVTRVVCAAVAALAVIVTAPQAYATSIIPDIGVDAGVMVTDTGTELGPLLLAAFGLGLAVMLGMLGFRLVRKFAKG